MVAIYLTCGVTKKTRFCLYASLRVLMATSPVITIV